MEHGWLAVAAYREGAALASDPEDERKVKQARKDTEVRMKAFSHTQAVSVKMGNYRGRPLVRGPRAGLRQEVMSMERVCPHCGKTGYLVRLCVEGVLQNANLMEMSFAETYFVSEEHSDVCGHQEGE